MDPAFRKARPHRPEVFLLCDISGSMATFARFTLQFTYAMATQFSKLRSFVFIDTVDEVTRYFGPGVDFNQALGRIATEAEAVWLDGHSDYGNSLARFEERYGSEITPRTTLIITGDARNNYRPPRAEILDRISAKGPGGLLAQPRAQVILGQRRLGDGALFARSVTAPMRSEHCGNWSILSSIWRCRGTCPDRRQRTTQLLTPGWPIAL